MTQSAFDIELDDLTIARARRGDMAACEKLFRLFNKPAYSIAFRICQCPQLAQDVTQEAFISAFRRIGQFRGDAPFWGWLRRVVINHAITALRRKPKSELVELELFDWAPAAGASLRILVVFTLPLPVLVFFAMGLNRSGAVRGRCTSRGLPLLRGGVQTDHFAPRDVKRQPRPRKTGRAQLLLCRRRMSRCGLLEF